MTPTYHAVPVLTWDIEVSDINRFAMVARDQDGLMVEWEELGRLHNLTLSEACAYRREVIAQVERLLQPVGRV